MEEEIKEEIEAGWQAAQETIDGFSDPAVIFDHIFETPPALLERQREAFLEQMKKEAGNG
jgi:hypothetical protein